MLNDIWETPEVLKRMLREHLQAAEGRVSFPSLEKPLPESHALAGRSALQVMADIASGGFKNRITVLGSGTSWHAALFAEYAIESIARIPVDVEYASEYRHRQPLIKPGDVLIVISSSGETCDAVESLRAVQRCEHGSQVLTLGFVNKAGSTIARESDAFVEALAGEEVGVAATKVFSSTLLALVLLAVALGTKTGTFAEDDRRELLAKLQELPGHVQDVLNHEVQPLRQEAKERYISIGKCMLWDLSCQNVLSNNFIFLGRGFNFPIALEGAMKCKEIAYIHAEGYPAAEMKHGPIALIDQFMPVVFIAPRSDPTYAKIKANIEEVKARNGSTIVITEEYNTELDDLCEYVIRVPSTHEYLMPIVSVIPLQLLSYMMGMLRGNEVDAPRGLQKKISIDAGDGTC